MDTPIEKRKLAAVLFADIEGYTALFQRSESVAFELVEQHRRDLKEVAEKHKGHIVKYYGDGSLTLFSSVIEAARGAIDLQQLSSEHHVPLRIGLHMGEMIEKDKDVYGDAVNVASRIQAIGISGSILVSKTIEDELKNHPNISTKSLGYTKLKNVKNPLEVFALTNPGLTIPNALPGKNRRIFKRAVYIITPIILLGIGTLLLTNKWKSNFVQFDNECVIIPPFISLTPDTSLDYFAKMASYELIKALSESAKVNAIPYNTMLSNTNADLASLVDNPALSRRLGADIEIRGAYTLEGKHLDTLRISLSILDLKQNKLFQTPIADIQCASANKRECLEQVKNVLVGYWKSKKSNLYHITTDSAFVHFLIAQNKWADPDEKEDIKSHLKKAIQFDPQFLDAWFLLLDFYHNYQAYDSGIATLTLIENLLPNLDHRQQDILGYYKADIQGNNVQAFKSFLKEYKQNPNDLFLNNTGMVMALEYLNDPLVAIQMFNQMEPDSMDLSTCDYCITRFSIALKAYIDLNNIEKAKLMVDRIKPVANKEPHFISLLKYYVMVKDTISINSVIQTATQKIKEEDEAAYLCLLTARMATVKGNLTLKEQYTSKAIRLYQKYDPTNLARSYLLAGNLKEAKSLLLEKLSQNKADRSTYAYLGIVYAKEGDKISANLMIDQLDKNIKTYDFGMTPYNQARIKANLGEFDAAMNYLNIAFEKGIRFLPITTFLNDPDMIIMNTDKEYISLMGRNRLNKIE